MGPETESDEGCVTLLEVISGAAVQVVYLSVAVGLLMVGPALLSFVTPFSFPFRNAFYLYGLAVILIAVFVTVDIVRTWWGQVG